jgi:hypothetical protein
MRSAVSRGPDPREFVRIEPDTAALRALVDFDGNGGGEAMTQHHHVGVVRAPQPDRVIDEGRGELIQVRDERVTHHAVGVFESRQLETIEPQPATLFADVRVDAADPQPRERHR